MTDITANPTPDNVVNFDANAQDSFNVWILDDISIGTSHSISISVSIGSLNEEESLVELVLVFFNHCRFEVSDFTIENDDIESRRGTRRALPKVGGLYFFDKSEYLIETTAKYEKEYPSDGNTKLYHTVVFDNHHTVNIVSVDPPKLIFQDKSHEAMLSGKEKEK